MKIAVTPNALEPIERAVRDAGATLAGPEDADGIVWTDPSDTDLLRSTLSASPARWVQLPFAGIERFAKAGVIGSDRLWTCAKGIYGHATAEQALALMLAAARRLHRRAREPRWALASGERRLAGATAVVVGTGGIGRALAAMLAPLRVRIIAVNRSGEPMPGAQRTVKSEALATVVAEADWLVLAAAHTPETTRMVGAELLALMKPDAWIVNVARGPLVDTGALVDALRAGRIGGAALDVTDPEPLPADHPLWSIPDVIITSHTANTFAMAVEELAPMVRRNVERFTRGEPLEGLVDPALGY